jgi:predicted transglutaminase-like cysteine proteinase
MGALCAVGFLATTITNDTAISAKSKRLFDAAAPRHTALVAVDRPTPARSLYYGLPARFFTINQVLARRRKNLRAAPEIEVAELHRTAIASDVNPVDALPARGNEPFGLFTFRAPEGQLWVKWRGLTAEIQREVELLAACRGKPSTCSTAVVEFNAIIAVARSYQGRARDALVNRLVNSAIQYTSDPSQHGMIDRWSAPLATFATGVPLADLRILIVRDRWVRQDHAVLAVRHAGHWAILDNRRTELVEDSNANHLVPMFALNSNGVQLFVTPYAMRTLDETEIAPAAPAADGTIASNATTHFEH